MLDETPLKPGSEAFFEIWDIFRKFVARDDNLFMRFIERVEGMEKSWLGFFPFPAMNWMSSMSRMSILRYLFRNSSIFSYRRELINSFVNSSEEI